MKAIVETKRYIKVNNKLENAVIFTKEFDSRDAAKKAYQVEIIKLIAKGYTIENINEDNTVTTLSNSIEVKVSYNK